MDHQIGNLQDIVQYTDYMVEIEALMGSDFMLDIMFCFFKLIFVNAQIKYAQATVTSHICRVISDKILHENYRKRNFIERMQYYVSC